MYKPNACASGHTVDPSVSSKLADTLIRSFTKSAHTSYHGRVQWRSTGGPIPAHALEGPPLAAEPGPASYDWRQVRPWHNSFSSAARPSCARVCSAWQVWGCSRQHADGARGSRMARRGSFDTDGRPPPRHRPQRVPPLRHEALREGRSGLPCGQTLAS